MSEPNEGQPNGETLSTKERALLAYARANKGDTLGFEEHWRAGGEAIAGALLGDPGTPLGGTDPAGAGGFSDTVQTPKPYTPQTFADLYGATRSLQLTVEHGDRAAILARREARLKGES